MRKLVAAEIVSLDGVFESPDEWTPAYFNPEVAQVIGHSLEEADTLLLGRRTYEEFAAVWPARGVDHPVGAFMNNSPKYVVSRTLDDLEWNNSFLIRDVVEDVRQLKAKPGRNINVAGSATLVRSLLHHGLVDELQLFVYPVIRSKGRKLFPAGDIEQVILNLETVRSFDTGLLHLTYVPDRSSSSLDRELREMDPDPPSRNRV